MVEISRSSFIPKEASGAVPSRVKRRRTFRVFGFIATVLLVGSLILAGGMYALKTAAAKNLESAKRALDEQSDLFKAEQLAEVREFDRRLRAAEMLMDDHVSPLKVFTALERGTKDRVQLTQFTYEYTPGFEALITIGGGTETFTTLALQQRQFSDDDILAETIFSELGTSEISNEELETVLATDDINFTFTGNVEASLIRYSSIPVIPPTDAAVPPSQEPIADEVSAAADAETTATSEPTEGEANTEPQ